MFSLLNICSMNMNMASIIVLNYLNTPYQSAGQNISQKAFKCRKTSGMLPYFLPLFGVIYMSANIKNGIQPLSAHLYKSPLKKMGQWGQWLI